MIIKKEYVMLNSDLSKIGEEIGVGWNETCDLLSNHGIHGEDGTGYCIIYNDQKYGDKLDLVMNKLFSDNPEAVEIYVMDDF
ncbi:hypothetical protein CPT_Privateer_059 [Proteus phage Privateer]|uniref:Uncharacterized protein n=1 Tax=Proteus phage Privateer TaxID=2712958 RepID=A0A6G8R3S9_9CAUD|nr:hypothetical protein HWD17_gp059 [Proteus phage Privateer]QIN94852.1 hypothetical protein CPT_Privateer_059 [Proteus phage Privateer]